MLLVVLLFLFLSANCVKEEGAKGEREVSSYEIGELVMLELRELDPVGYVRFASVYRDFQDVSEFAVEIQKFSSDRDS